MSDFKDLKVWQKAHKMALETHRVACKIRGPGRSGMRSQMIDAALSVPTNIVESRGQRTRREGCRYLRMAVNSSTELEYHLIAAFELKAISRAECETLTTKLVEVRKMLYGLIRSLSKGDDPNKPPPES